MLSMVARQGFMHIALAAVLLSKESLKDSKNLRWG
jgi:hypothetical protein